jgi:protein gp37
LSRIDWVIVGGESGHHARPMDIAWARSIRDQCASDGVPFFLKQLGGNRDKRGGAKARLDGKTHRAFPRPETRIRYIHQIPATLPQT